jgi:hypothetical protein
MGPNSNLSTEEFGYYRGGQLNFIQPRKTVENAFIVSLNGRLPKKCLNVHQLASLDEAQAILEARRLEANPHRPHRLRGRLTPSKFISQRQEERNVEDTLCPGGELSRPWANVREACSRSRAKFKPPFSLTTTTEPRRSLPDKLWQTNEFHCVGIPPTFRALLKPG